jgi:ATP-binding cassette subfamily B protein
MTSANHPGGAPVRVLRRFVRQVSPYHRLLTTIWLLDLLTIPLALLLPLPIKLAIDSLTGTALDSPLWKRFLAMMPAGHAGPILAAAVLMLAVAVAQHVVGFVNWLLRTYTGEKLVLGFRSQLFAHVQRLSLSYHDLRGASETTYRIQVDAVAARDTVLNGVLPLVNAALMLIGMLYVTVRIDWQLATVALVAAPCLLLLTSNFSSRLRDEWTDVRDRDSMAMSVVQEVLNSVRVVKAFGAEEREQQRFLRHSGSYVQGQMRLSRMQAGFYVLVGLTLAVSSAVTLLLGARHVRDGVLTVGSLLLVMSYVAKLYEPLGTLSNKWVELQSSIVSLKRSFSLLDIKPDVVERKRAKGLRRAKGALSFLAVNFHYDPNKPILHNVTFDIVPGMHVGIMGPSGAGKSTLLSLVTRLHDPVRGTILLDGIDLRDYQLAALREQFAIVLQDPVLFSTTIAENIAYARPEASRADIVKAAKAARAHDFIMRLPNGYDTEVGLRGATLSGGERQRISLARAFLKDAPVLIMDEPTSSLDVQTESEIVQATEALMRGRTTFVVAHRASTLEHCDVQFWLEHGTLTLVAGELPHNVPVGDEELVLISAPQTIGAD